ncbi:MAG: ATP-binding protein, partial [Coriobacteriia bacterium]|nr:ATP-binding protein [Coriobacteriia bacterium]
SDSFARRPFQPLELSSLLAEVVAKARSLGPRRITLRCSAALWVIGDPDALEQALLNVMRNAVQHTKIDGEISVSCSAEHEHARIEIADDGPGLKPEDADRVFDRFYRASGPRPSDSGGSGLGLSITRRLLEQHSGSIEALSDGRSGARFIIQVPLTGSPE